MVINNTSITYDNVTVPGNRIYFKLDKLAEEADSYWFWPPYPRGIMLMANDSSIFQLLNDSQITIKSQAIGEKTEQ